jgi:hypothetical protein
MILSALANTTEVEDYSKYVPKKFIVESNEDGTKGEKIYNIKNSRIRIAALIFRSHYPFISYDFPQDRKNNDELWLNIKTYDFDKEFEDVFIRYGYQIEKNLLGDFIINMREEKNPSRFNALYPKEFDSDINSFILKLLAENGCSVIDITPIKNQLDWKKLKEVIAYYRTSQNIDAFFIFCYQTYSRTNFYDPKTHHQRNDIGLKCDYIMELIDAKNYDTIFEDKGTVNAFVSASNRESDSYSMKAPIEWMKEEGKRKIGIINREWLEKDFLNNFKSYETIYETGPRKKDKPKPFAYSIAAKLKYDFDKLKGYPEFVGEPDDVIYDEVSLIDEHPYDLKKAKTWKGVDKNLCSKYFNETGK